MLKKDDLERIHIRKGVVDEDGIRQDILTSKVHGKSIVPNEAKQALEWRWRLLVKRAPTVPTDE
jgi:hypothetical protein